VTIAWSDLVVAAGLDPSEVSVMVLRRRFRRQKPVVATHASRGLASQADGRGSTAANAAAAIEGLADLMTGGAY
jgi:hypothetical protein